MHKWAYEIMECLKAEVSSKGIDNLSSQEIDDMKDWSEIAKNITCFEKDYKIVESMEKADNEENMEMISRYTDYPKRYMMDSSMYREHDPDYWRDMDRKDGKMYYTPSHSVSSRSVMRRFYDSKETHPLQNETDNTARMKALDEDMIELRQELSKVAHKMTPTEQQRVIAKLESIVNEMKK